MIRGHMMKYGPFVFSINTAAYQTLQRQDSYRWQSVEVLGTELAQQYMGPGERTINLSGVVFTHYDAGRAPFSPQTVGTEHINNLRGVADAGSPLMLTDGRGRSYGRWVVKSLSNSETMFMDNGAPKKQEFDLSLCFYSRRSADGFGLSSSSFLGGVFTGGAVVQVFSSAQSLTNTTVGVSISPSDKIVQGMTAAGVELNLGANLDVDLDVNLGAAVSI